jgi:hypothetical protein
MALQFQRNADVYVRVLDAAGGTVEKTWKVPVLEGFSFSQSVNSSEITINEAGTTSRRARLLFNDSLAPVEWSFSTYIRPTSETSPANCVAPEQALWAMLVGANGFNATTEVYSNDSISPSVNVNAVTTDQNTFNFNGSNISAMPDNWEIVFAFEDGANQQYFTIDKAVVNSASIDFDIEGIATCAWSGFGASLAETTSTPTDLSSAVTDGITGTSNFIRNRISTVSLIRTDSSPDDTYNIVLTGGSFSIENNITYLTPEELGVVNSPLANITGARTVSGSLTCYFDNDTANSKSGELFADLVSDTSTVRNVFDMAINIGGEAASTPRLVLDLPTAHLEIPTIGVEDVLTLETNFHAQVANGNVDSTNEATIIYKS